MFDLINGIPVHPLVVHAVVVLLPLAILGTVALACRPAWRVTHGWALVALSAVATVLIPVATQSGESLERRVGDPGQHAHLGDQLIWFALPVLVLDVVMVLIARRGVRPASVGVQRVVAGLAVVAALACAVQVYRVGESGARAVWADQVTSQISAR